MYVRTSRSRQCASNVPAWSWSASEGTCYDPSPGSVGIIKGLLSSRYGGDWCIRTKSRARDQTSPSIVRVLVEQRLWSETFQTRVLYTA